MLRELASTRGRRPFFAGAVASAGDRWPLRLALAAVVAIAIALAPTREIGDREIGDRCAAPEELWRLESPIPRTTGKLRAGAPLTIVAIGSSSTAGAGASAPERTYPHRLGVELGKLFPRFRIRVLNKGVGGHRVAEMIERFDRDVIAHRPDLVIWQVGSNSILRNEWADDFGRELRHGIARLREGGFDVLLMDAQFAPRITERPAANAILDATRAAARASGVSVFPRFAIMRHWAESGNISPTAMLSGDRLHLNDVSYGCLARLLAGAIAAEAD